MLYRLSDQFRIDAAGRPVRPAPIAEASAHYGAGHLDDAASCCRLIITRDPRDFDALHLLGVICSDRGDHAAALDWLTRAAAVRPDVARLQYHIGNALMADARHIEAESRFRRAVALDAGLVGALNNLGSTLRSQDRDTEAIGLFHRALALRPGWAPALFNLGVSQARLGRFDDAVASFRAVLAAPGDSPAEKLAEVHDALAQALMALWQHEAALEVCRARCALTPGDARGEWHHALALLTLGRFAEGWELYERRWELPGFRDEDAARLAPPRVPRLAELDGKRVLLRAEQGRGDVIQFCRYAPLVAGRAAAVVVAVPADLVALMRTLPGVDAVSDDADAEPEHDIAAALLSLPLTFGTDAANIPATVPYL
ncbi:MAG TPA: tetratricopeptide repeat protein, partial [Acetobacteraceae bacterium]|nr:tetratricopeptide repeat protein [Acetobacteraceae bacterium]